MNSIKQNIKEIINYLDQFYTDVGLLTKEIIKQINDNDFEIHPKQGNKISWGKNSVSNHVENFNQWTLKNIQLCYLKKNITKYDKALFTSLSLYKNSAFEVPILLVCVANFKELMTQEDIWLKAWTSDNICDIDSYDSSWRFLDKNQNYVNLIHKLCLPSNDSIKFIDLMIFDLMLIDCNKTIHNYVIEPLMNLFNTGKYEDDSNPILIKIIPDSLFKKWNNNIELQEEE